jgi:hypothetical protein
MKAVARMSSGVKRSRIIGSGDNFLGSKLYFLYMVYIKLIIN